MKKTFWVITVLGVLVFLILPMFLPSDAFAQSIDNPLRVNSIQEIIAFALKFVVDLLAIAGVLYIIWTGFLFVKAQGNPEELSKAKKSFLNAVIGMAIILGACAIANAIANTLNQVTNSQTKIVIPK